MKRIYCVELKRFTSTLERNFEQGNQTFSCLCPVTDVLRLKIYWFEVQLYFLCATYVFFFWHIWSQKCVFSLQASYKFNTQQRTNHLKRNYGSIIQGPAEIPDDLVTQLWVESLVGNLSLSSLLARLKALQLPWSAGL